MCQISNNNKPQNKYDKWTQMALGTIQLNKTWMNLDNYKNKYKLKLNKNWQLNKTTECINSGLN